MCEAYAVPIRCFFAAVLFRRRAFSPPCRETPLTSENTSAARADEKLNLVHRLFSGTGPSYDFMVAAATFGIDRRWKRIIVDRLPADPARVLDLACGTGILTFAIARRYPRCRMVGVELRDEYLQIARDKARALKLDNVEFVLSRAEDYASAQKFDCVVSSYLAKYADLVLLTRRTAALLEDGGLVLMHDFTHPPKAVAAVAWCAYMTLLRAVGTPFFPAWREIFRDLPGLIERTRWCDELTAALEENGFRDIRKRYLTCYGSALVTARK
jgi:demethylmenaquinone methyltransferase/2-methoxy-6-polyprenyl-1,4-benzoquinol methylase